MKRRLLLIVSLLLLCEVLSAQTYHYTFSHDTLGNRKLRVYQGVRTAEGEVSTALGMTEEDSPGTTQSPVIPTGQGEWRDPEDPGIETDGHHGALDITSVAKDTVKYGKLVKSPAEKEAYLEAMMDYVVRMQPLPGDGQRVVPQGPVGEIPLSYGVSGTGARTYSIPIYTAPDIKYAPSLSLVYNSQGGYGYGGYGWDLAGLSSITLTGKTSYWDGEIEPANASDRDGVFCLDGVRLVTNGDVATNDDYPLVTATGHILASPRMGTNGYIKAFDVLYPDGTQAIYGFGTSLGFTLPSYPLVSSTNAVGEKIEYCYSLDTASGSHAIDSVRYGIDAAGNAAAVVRFTADTSAVYSYYAGKKVKRSPRVSSIASCSSGNALYTYSLAYQTHQEYGNLTLLKSVSLTNASGESFPPLTFTYGAEAFPHPAPDSLKVSATRDLSYLVFPSTGAIALRRGKFCAGNYNDGLIAWSDLPVYYEVINGRYACGFDPSAIPPQSYAFVASIADNTAVIPMPHGDGFQTLEAVDTDGDGKDELVRVSSSNAVSPSQMGTTLFVTKYVLNGDGNPTDSASFSVLLNGCLDTGNYMSPYRRTYRWGDFLGNGKTQLVAVTYSDNGFGYSQSPAVALIDLDEGEKLYDIQNSYHLNISSSDDRLLQASVRHCYGVVTVGIGL